MKNLYRSLYFQVLVAIALAVFSVAAALGFHRDFADTNQLIHFLKNMPPETFLHLVARARCILGNSSTGIRIASSVTSRSNCAVKRNDVR